MQPCAVLHSTRTPCRSDGMQSEANSTINTGRNTPKVWEQSTFYNCYCPKRYIHTAVRSCHRRRPCSGTACSARNRDRKLSQCPAPPYPAHPRRNLACFPPVQKYRCNTHSVLVAVPTSVHSASGPFSSACLSFSFSWVTAVATCARHSDCEISWSHRSSLAFEGTCYSRCLTLDSYIRVRSVDCAQTARKNPSQRRPCHRAPTAGPSGGAARVCLPIWPTSHPCFSRYCPHYYSS